jgi:hydroxymethylglutaryl-CoA reductase (NADPH)
MMLITYAFKLSMPKLNLLGNNNSSVLLSETLEERLSPRKKASRYKLTRSSAINKKSVEQRWSVLDNLTDKSQLLDSYTEHNMLCYRNNIENFIGTVKLPVGIAGPLRVNGLFANDDYLIPLATTEAALVASYHRGAKLITLSGGASAMLINEGVTRTPCFAFTSIIAAGQFVAWVVTQFELFKTIAEQTTAHGRLKDIHTQLEGNYVYLVFEFITGDASGQNMVTIATNTVFEYIQIHSPIVADHAFLDGNLSGDKKPNQHVLRSVRGKKVTAEVTIEARLIEKYLHTTAEKMCQFGRMNTLGATLSGSIGVNAHYANALAALYIATGQDPACVAESAVGVTRMDLNKAGDLHASVTLPNIMVGTVGGGTRLPSQKACLDIMGLSGNGSARALAEITAALCLAGELSIVGAFCAGHFSRAHQKLARGRIQHKTS